MASLGYCVWFAALLIVLHIAGSQADRGEFEDDDAKDDKQIHRHVTSPSKIRPSKDSESAGIDRSNSDASHGTAQRVHSHVAAMTARGTFHRLKTPTGVAAAANPALAQATTQQQPAQPVAQGGTGTMQAAITPPWLDDQQEAAQEELIENVENAKVSDTEVLMALGGGTGATIGGTGILDLDVDLVRRMRYQDKAVMMLLMVIYFVTLAFSACFSYKQALNSSPVTFYADPRYHDFVMEGHDNDAFLAGFAGSPKDVHLQVTGFVPVSSGVLGSIEWQGEFYYDAFSFALDLSPWVVRQGTADGAAMVLWSDNESLVDGVVAADMEDLDFFLRRDRNELSMLELHKEVAWESWEELATNIKHKIRQKGFSGIISVQRTDSDTVTIFKNSAWPNFLHSRTTKVLCALSVLGWAIYLPYMWLRCSSTSVRARYTVDIAISAYWDLIADKLTSEGFVEDPDAIRTNPFTEPLTPVDGRNVDHDAFEYPGIDDEEDLGIQADFGDMIQEVSA